MLGPLWSCLCHSGRGTCARFLYRGGRLVMQRTAVCCTRSFAGLVYHEFPEGSHRAQVPRPEWHQEIHELRQYQYRQTIEVNLCSYTIL